jgi:hypothetical protein
MVSRRWVGELNASPSGSCIRVPLTTPERDARGHGFASQSAVHPATVEQLQAVLTKLAASNRFLSELLEQELEVRIGGVPQSGELSVGNTEASPDLRRPDIREHQRGGDPAGDEPADYALAIVVIRVHAVPREQQRYSPEQRKHGVELLLFLRAEQRAETIKTRDDHTEGEQEQRTLLPAERIPIPRPARQHEQERAFNRDQQNERELQAAPKSTSALQQIGRCGSKARPACRRWTNQQLNQEWKARRKREHADDENEGKPESRTHARSGNEQRCRQQHDQDGTE